jgi:hypothetical protein
LTSVAFSMTRPHRKINAENDRDHKEYPHRWNRQRDR